MQIMLFKLLIIGKYCRPSRVQGEFGWVSGVYGMQIAHVVPILMLFFFVLLFCVYIPSEVSFIHYIHAAVSSTLDQIII